MKVARLEDDTLQDPEARSDLGPTAWLGPRLHRASVTTGLGGASVRGSTEPRWRFGEIKNGWIWCNLAHIWWIHEACGGGCGRGRWDPPDQREIRRDPAVFKPETSFSPNCHRGSVEPRAEATYVNVPPSLGPSNAVGPRSDRASGSCSVRTY